MYSHPWAGPGCRILNWGELVDICAVIPDVLSGTGWVNRLMSQGGEDLYPAIRGRIPDVLSGTGWVNRPMSQGGRSIFSYPWSDPGCAIQHRVGKSTKEPGVDLYSAIRGRILDVLSGAG